VIDKLKLANNELLEELSNIRNEYIALQQKEKNKMNKTKEELNNNYYKVQPGDNRQKKDDKNLSQQSDYDNQNHNNNNNNYYYPNQNIHTFNTLATQENVKERSPTRTKIENSKQRNEQRNERNDLSERTGNDFFKYNNVINNTSNNNKFVSKSPQNFQVQDNTFELNQQNNDKNEKLVKISNMVINFVAEMKSLQESISKKVPNVPELKKEFENNKSDLLNFARNIIGIKPSHNINNSNTIGNKDSSKDTSIISNFKPTPIKISNKDHRDKPPMTINSINSGENTPNKGRSPIVINNQNNNTNPNNVNIKPNENLVNTIGNGQEIVNIQFKTDENEKLITAFEKLKREKNLLDELCEDLTKEKKELMVGFKIIKEKLRKVDEINKYGEINKDISLEDAMDILIKNTIKNTEKLKVLEEESSNYKTILSEYKSKNGILNDENKSLKYDNQKLKSKESESNKVIIEKDYDLECKIIIYFII